MVKKLSLTTLAAREYEIIAFVTGFGLMVFELVASRILAPTIGSSTYVWTSVIGVIIAALSLGYAAGGWLADKRVNRQDISWLLLAAAAAITFTLVFANGILDLVSSGGMDARLKGLLASLLLFMPTSFLLGVISPYLVRLHTNSLEVAGRSVASLSALNAIGGIVGTFSAGFIFFSYVGSRQTLVLLIIVFVAASWLLRPTNYWVQRALFGLVLLLIAASSLIPKANAATVASIDTPTAHYEVIDTMYGDKKARVLASGPSGWQSGIYLEHPTELAFTYTQLMAGMVQIANEKSSILILGGGAYTLPEYLANHHPYSQVDVVEIDPQLEKIAKQYFGYQSPPNVRSIAADGRAYLNNNTKKYDVIVVDIYNDLSVPFATTTREYVESIKKSLTPNGILLVNMVGANTAGCTPLLGGLHSTYQSVLPFYRAFPTITKSLSTKQNLVVLYTAKQPKWLLPSSQSVGLPNGQILHDNFAPVERLHQQC